MIDLNIDLWEHLTQEALEEVLFNYACQNANIFHSC